MLKVAICQPHRLMVPKIMELLQISRCKRELNFSPLKEWPSALPLFSWNSQLLCGFSRQEGVAIALDCKFHEAIVSLYPELSFAELARLYTAAETAGLKAQNDSDIDWEKVFSHYGFRFDRNIELAAKKLCLCPSQFINWCAEKSVGPRELGVIRSVDDELLNNENSSFQKLFLSITDGLASKSLGTQALELGCELLLMGEVLPPAEKNFEIWLKKIKATRFPKSSQRDTNDSQTLKRLPWPKKSNVQWVRHGDRAGISLQLQIYDVDELAAQSLSIQRVLEEVQKDPQILWKN